MIIEHVEVRCVRNVTAASLDLSPGLNLLVGPNGAGKTALLEALHLLIRGRSFRGRGVSLLIQHGEPALSVHLLGADPARGRVNLGVARERSNDTELRLNGEAVRQASVVAGLLPVQLLLPDLAELVFGSPGERRQWLDWGVFHVKHDYVDTLRDYLRSVRQRNAVLRTEDHGTLEAWTGRMVELGEAVTEARRSYLDAVRPTVQQCLEHLAPGLAVTLEYYPGYQGDSLAKEVFESTARDVKSGATQAGPHRADIRLASDRGRAAGILSRGQGKALASALRIGQAKALLDEQGARSLFLIDDVWAELDDDHSVRFFGLLDEMDCQILATSTHEPRLAAAFGRGRSKVFHVEQGAVTEHD